MFKDFKSVVEIIIWLIVGYYLCQAFGFIGGLLIAIVAIPILMILWYCLCFIVGGIISLVAFGVEKLTEEKYDDIKDINETDEK